MKINQKGKQKILSFSFMVVKNGGKGPNKRVQEC